MWTIKQLIEELEVYNPDSEVTVRNGNDISGKVRNEEIHATRMIVSQFEDSGDDEAKLVAIVVYPRRD